MLESGERYVLLNSNGGGGKTPKAGRAAKPKGGSEFDRLLLEAVDEGLGVLGESPRHAIYFWLEKNHGIGRDEIPQKLDAFTSSLEKMFSFGAFYIQRQILEKLHSKLNLKYKEKGGYKFADYVNEAKREYLRAVRRAAK
jgi:hypothetical protein